MTIQTWIQAATHQLGPERAIEAQLLAAHSVGQTRTWVLVHGDHSIDGIADEFLGRRLQGEPMAYILGGCEFYGRWFTVTPAALVPRQDTETVVEHTLAILDPGHARVLDVGTGSGCIAITLAAERPNWLVDGIDVDPAALAVAQTNSERMASRVNLFLSDLTESVTGTYDLLVSNPPYVAMTDPLGPGVAEFEPHTALFAEENGLAVYRRLAESARSHLSANGWIVLEIGMGQGEAIRSLFRDHDWQFDSSRADLGGIERSLAFRLP